jgi:hypothetical protein
MSTLQFYIERAADCRRQADATNLQNVRARCLSAADAWDEMADRVRRTQVYRDEDAARKAGVSSQATQSNPAPDESVTRKTA